ncbi:MAG: SpoIID/LytB domain-containing protein [Planctomycetota bacterium]|nr:MAG: SpoIID/LytB domain-containing protein [Planctomycetota bacterium]
MNHARCAAISLSLLALVAVLVVMPWSLRRPTRESLTGGPSESLAATSKALSRADQATVRVAVTSSPQKQIELSIDGPYQLRPVGSDKVLSRGQSLGTSTVTATSTGFKIGKVEHAVTRLEIVATQSPSIWVNGHEYRGNLRLFRRSGGGVLAVNVLPLGEYLASVVDSEMPTSFGTEARKAQAIVARTYALDVVRSDEGDSEFDLFASTSSQKYLGFQYRDGSRRLAGESEASRQIVRDTTGMVCTFQGRLFRTYYSAACGGHTTQGSAVFADAVAALKSVPCDFCREAKLYRWQADLPKADVETKLKAYFRSEGKTFDKLQTIKLASGNPDRGTEVPEFAVNDGKRSHRISAATLRRQLSVSTLYSPFFTISETGKSNTLHFEGRGHGHAVGLCQWGARGQSLLGKTGYEIVRYYYSGAKIVQLQ